MKNIPNMITSIRLVSAIVIAMISCFAPHHGSGFFLPLFVAAAISDMLDGFIARRFNWCTKFGATLDSISDLALYCSASIYFALTAPQALTESAFLLLVGVAVQIFHICFSLKRFAKFPAYHTDFSRLCAYAIFFLVLAFSLLNFIGAFKLISIMWILCSFEGIAITAILKNTASDLSGINEAIKTSLQQPDLSNAADQASADKDLMQKAVY